MSQVSWIDLASVIVPLGVIVASLFVGWIAKRLTDWYRRSRTAQDVVRPDDVVLSISEGLILPFFALVGTLVALQVSTLPPDVRAYANSVIAALLVLAVTLIAARVLKVLIHLSLPKVEPLAQIVPVLERVAQIALWAIGLMIALSYLGADITPLITTLGVGGLAAALALQDTLANFFAGFYILADRPIRVGDYIKLSSGEEGYVIEIGWRSAKIRTLPNNVVIVPNQKLSQSIITNYHMPEQRMSLLIPVSVSYDSDPANVEEILVDIAKTASREIEGMLSEPEPFVRFIPGFGEYSLDFTLICQVREFVDQYYVQHELRKRIFARFAEEHIEIPFPVRTLHLSNGRDGRSNAWLQASLGNVASKGAAPETG
ncbi:MAG: mechanosensitive ion channel family protein [Chloroflexi bacterium]|nr:mechanosensitive ion channel family protein [Chloroflexota bacterium]